MFVTRLGSSPFFLFQPANDQRSKKTRSLSRATGVFLQSPRLARRSLAGRKRRDCLAVFDRRWWKEKKKHLNSIQIKKIKNKKHTIVWAYLHWIRTDRDPAFETGLTAWAFNKAKCVSGLGERYNIEKKFSNWNGNFNFFSKSGNPTVVPLVTAPPMKTCDCHETVFVVNCKW